jgi:hypothetical protein
MMPERQLISCYECTRLIGEHIRRSLTSPTFVAPVIGWVKENLPVL